MISINKISISLLILLAGIFLRLFQLNFEDYWLDEMVSFWVADPNLSLDGVIERNYFIGQTPPLFDLFLKKYFEFFGYEPKIGRQFPLILGALSIPLLGALTYRIKDNNSYLLAIFLVSINIYLIKYSQETRPYIFVFLLSILNIIFYYNLNLHSNHLLKKILFTILFISISVITYSTHPFTLIILFSQIFHIVYLKIFFKKNSYTFLISLPFTIIIYLFFNYDYLIAQLSYNEYFLSQENWKFYYNYYFSRFFGSKIMGLIYLSTLIYLILFFRKKIFYEQNNYLFLIILLFFSYIIPLTYGFIRTPVLTDRYIIFVLIPVLILISCLIFEIKNNYKKFFLLFYILIPTLFNNYIEISKRQITKPEFTKFFNEIKHHEVNNFFILGEANFSMLVKNYIINLKEFNKQKNIILNKDTMIKGNKFFWSLCYEPINGFDCSISNISETKLILIETKQYHLFNAKLYEITD